MKEKLNILLICVLATILVLGACTPQIPSDSNPDTPPKTSDPSDSEDIEGNSNNDVGGEKEPVLSDEITPMVLLSSGWVNVPITDPNDPYYLYIKDKFKLDVNLLSYPADDFDQQLSVMLASEQKPDLINAGRLTLKNYYDQQVLIDDWTPWLDYMPRTKAFMVQDEMLYQQAQAPSGELMFVFANRDVPQWSLKVRRDWLNEWAAENNKPEGYDLQNSEELLDFARWVKDTKNQGASKATVYPFTSSGNGTSIGTSIEWTQGIFGHSLNGLGNDPRMGFYITDDGDVSNPMIDGTYAQWLEFMKTVYNEKLINPDWFTQDWGTKGNNLYDGKAAFDWYPGVIVQETLSMNAEKAETNNGLDTYDWWDNMDVPANDGNKYQGIPTAPTHGHTWSVSYETSLDEDKMMKICALLNDVTMLYNEGAEDQSYFDRPESYDRLRWGVGIQEGFVYEPIPDSKLNLIDMDPFKKDDPDAVNYFAESPGAWDWGSWFSCNNDGVVHASNLNDPEKVKFIEKVGILNDTSGMKSYEMPGAYFEYDSAKLQAMFDSYVQFTYQYMTGSNTISVDQYIDRWRTELEGDLMLIEAEKQFKEKGLMK